MRGIFVSDLTPVGISGYPLNDDGTLAAYGAVGFMPTNAPDYLQADYTFTQTALNSTVISAPTLEHYFTEQAIPVLPGTIVHYEAKILACNADTYSSIGIAFAISNGGVFSAGGNVFANDNTGSDPSWNGSGISEQPRTVPIVNAIIGVELNGNDGSITLLTSDGPFLSSNTFTPGDSVTFSLFVRDGEGDGPVGRVVSIKSFPYIADCVLTISEGAIGPADYVDAH